MNVIEAMSDADLFGPWFRGTSWDGWRTVLKALYGLPMSEAERDFLRSVAEREPPQRRVREGWFPLGRRGGKDSIASLIVAHEAATFEDQDRLRPGERALCMCLACDRDQAKIVLNYIHSYFSNIPMLRAMVTRETATGFELDNGVDIAVATNSFRSVRGRSILCAVFDEVAYWRDETSASPDEEVYRAIVPGMATLPNALLLGISSPYRKAGLLYKKFRDHFGQDSEDVLVVRAPSIVMNPTLDQAIIDKALEEDPTSAEAEWLAQFRDDISEFVSREAVEACVARGRHELPPVSGLRYRAFVDPAGGSGGDSMTLAISHLDKDRRAILDVVRERRPKFSPQQVVAEFAELLKTYHVTEVIGDHWGGEFVKEPFRNQGITYKLSEQTKSDIYQSALAHLNSGNVELLDNPRLIAQICGLERRTARSGKDSIDHAPGGHDDICNSALGALLVALSKKAPMVIPDSALQMSAVPTAWRSAGRLRRMSTFVGSASDIFGRG